MKQLLKEKNYRVYLPNLLMFLVRELKGLARCELLKKKDDGEYSALAEILWMNQKEWI